MDRRVRFDKFALTGHFHNPRNASRAFKLPTRFIAIETLNISYPNNRLFEPFANLIATKDSFAMRETESKEASAKRVKATEAKARRGIRGRREEGGRARTEEEKKELDS